MSGVSSSYIPQVKTAVFEGPLDLLIELVEKRKLLINDISLATVTDEYLARVSAMQEQSLPHTAQFVALAATLLLIKSKSLLPNLDLTSEEEATIDDLEQRLKYYQIFRTASETLQTQFGRAIMYEPEYTPPREPLFMPDTYCTVDALAAAMRSVIDNLPREVVKPKAHVTPVVSLEEMMTRLQRRIERQFKTRFSELCANEPERKTVIVGFLAILELFKQGNVLVTQVTRFADIEIELEQSGTPRYY
jgi:segregation and condensation protein A